MSWNGTLALLENHLVGKILLQRGDYSMILLCDTLELPYHSLGYKWTWKTLMIGCYHHPDSPEMQVFSTFFDSSSSCLKDDLLNKFLPEIDNGPSHSHIRTVTLLYMSLMSSSSNNSVAVLNWYDGNPLVHEAGLLILQSVFPFEPIFIWPDYITGPGQIFCCPLTLFYSRARGLFG